ncbi:hypothetical protein MMB17_11535 [Methylobacterium organophilum]|uniref:hypothetical protein n=1 Tax=Methylobacterium organophilum TaxID=410 RepID=UPI001F12AD5A|nr:hypothetical protein [Methylobacterium organophilum]UMY19866.1 hypothetical protein MMB17_11535 [Methylobacterium organophilum]
MTVDINDYVARDSDENTMTVLKVEGDRALCSWYPDGEVEGDPVEEWIPLAELTVLQKALRPR